VSCFIYCYTECHYAECRYAECRYDVCRYAECYGASFLALFTLKLKKIDVFYQIKFNNSLASCRDHTRTVDLGLMCRTLDQCATAAGQVFLLLIIHFDVSEKNMSNA
jgi:hypothetical protein